jgi:hypothetical protein
MCHYNDDPACQSLLVYSTAAGYIHCNDLRAKKEVWVIQIDVWQRELLLYFIAISFWCFCFFWVFF